MSTIDLNEADRDLPMDLPIEIRVKAGMALLDEKYGPEWVRRINVDELELADTCRCVLGQIEGSYWSGLSILPDPPDHPLKDLFAAQPRDFGFHAGVPCETASQRGEWDSLTIAWKAAILARRAELAT